MQIENLDVVIVGAGVSGINMAVRLQQYCPDKTYTILESKESLGGTWDTFRYPGVRSDLDMWTYSFPFKPWTKAKTFGSGRMILNYLKDTAREFKVEEHIQYQQQVISANWDNKLNRWQVIVQNNETIKQINCQFLLMCAGYFKHSHGHTPVFTDSDKFKGKIIHTQQWSNDLRYENKNIIVIGSGATAVGIVPVLAQKAKQVTMLQRSPSYILSPPDISRGVIDLYQRFPKLIAYFLLRWKYIFSYEYTAIKIFKNPTQTKELFLHSIANCINPKLVDRHFTPTYDPWKQRICISPNGELFAAINKGSVNMVTNEIDYFTETGIVLKTGELLTADIVVLATGLETQPFGGIELLIDNHTISLDQHVSYRGCMLSNIPNLAYVQGYFTNSWMIRSDLISKFICNHVIRPLKNSVIPHLSKNIETINHLDEWGNESGYWQRSWQRNYNKFYKFGTKQPWKDTQRYYVDWFLFKIGRFFDRTLKFK